MKIKKLLASLIVLAGVVSLTACNSGGGGSSGGGDSGGVPDSYTGARTEATITTDNAEQLADNVYNFSNPADFVVFRSAGGDKAQGVAKVRSVVDKAKSLSRVTGETINETIPGDYSGYVQISGSGSETSFTVTLVFVDYSDYEFDDAMDGTMTVTGSFSASGDYFTSTMKITFSDNFTVGPVSIRGSVKEVATEDYYGDYYKYTTTMNLAYDDSSTGYQFAYENLVWTDEYDGVAGTYTMTMDGRIYDGDYGYVDIETTIPIVLDLYSGLYLEGELILTGAGGSSIKLVFDGYDVVAYLDENGDGVYAEGSWYVN